VLELALDVSERTGLTLMGCDCVLVACLSLYVVVASFEGSGVVAGVVEIEVAVEVLPIAGELLAAVALVFLDFEFPIFFFCLVFSSKKRPPVLFLKS
jgi:hypothetical protein